MKEQETPPDKVILLGNVIDLSKIMYISNIILDDDYTTFMYECVNKYTLDLFKFNIKFINNAILEINANDLYKTLLEKSVKEDLRHFELHDLLNKNREKLIEYWNNNPKIITIDVLSK